MSSNLTNKHIILGVTGSIAAYKSGELIRRLRDQGAIVRVVMTKSAQLFITPLTLQALSGHPVHDDLFDPAAEAAMGHIELARWADMIVIAPATADIIARMAQGRADDLLTTLLLATRAPILIAPAMNQAMWSHDQTQKNAAYLQSTGVTFAGPAEGSQACGDTGPGRLSEPNDILAAIHHSFRPKILAGVKVLITAGATQESIDPVRYISNKSSGKMGYALAESFVEAGATVTLVSAPTALATPFHVSRVNVTTAEEMFHAVKEEVQAADIFVSVAAVSDYRPKTIASQKIKKQDSTFILECVRNPDIAKEVGHMQKKPFLIGFAAETENVLENAVAKLKAKNMDMIIANRVSAELGMMADENEVTVLTHTKKITLPRASKKQIAHQLTDIIAEEFKNHDRKNHDAGKIDSNSHA